MRFRVFPSSRGDPGGAVAMRGCVTSVVMGTPMLQTLGVRIRASSLARGRRRRACMAKPLCQMLHRDPRHLVALAGEEVVAAGDRDDARLRIRERDLLGPAEPV